MKTTTGKGLRRLLSVALSAAMCAGLAVPAALAADPTTELTLDTATAAVGSLPSTVTMTVGTTEAMTLGGFGFEAYSDDTSITISALTISSDWTGKGMPTSNITTGRCGFLGYDMAAGKTANFDNIKTWATVTYSIPSDLAAGEYTLGVRAVEGNIYDSTATESAGVRKVVTESKTITFTVTDPAATTGAQLNKTSASVAVGGKLSLTASLLPDTTTDTITAIDWTSSDAAATVTGDKNGATVTGISEGSATITAAITTAAGKTYSAQCEVTVTAAPKSPYTFTIDDGVAGTAVVHRGDTVVMKVAVAGATFYSPRAVVSYDSTLFDYVSATGFAEVKNNGNGTLTVSKQSTTAQNAGTEIAQLTFKAKTDLTATATGDFGFVSATAHTTPDETLTEDALPAATTGDSVKILMQYTVTFMNDGTEYAKEVVDEGAFVTSTVIDTDPAKDYHDFAGWTADGTTVLTAAQVKAQAVTADVTYTAKYTPKTYTVTKSADQGASDASTATYGEDYVGTIADHDSASYDYVVVYTVAGGEEKNAAVSGSSFTIPGTDITGDVTIQVKKVLKGFTIEVKNNYVPGYSLIVVKNEAGNNKIYTYDGNAMYAAYDGYAWIVEDETGALTVDLAKTKVGLGTAVAGTVVSGSYDVNGSGTVDWNDASAAFYASNASVGLDSHMAQYLKADVNGDKVVDATDVNAIVEQIH